MIEDELTVENVDWLSAIKVARAVKSSVWYEDYDEAAGGFLGWRKVKNDAVVTFKEFAKWWADYNNNLAKRKK